jgi:hypothetical protein
MIYHVSVFLMASKETCVKIIVVVSRQANIVRTGQECPCHCRACSKYTEHQ